MSGSIDTETLAGNSSVSELPKGWKWKNVGDISERIHYGYTASSTNVSTDTKLLRITDIQNNLVDWITVPFCEISEAEKQKYLLSDGDLVFARTGATVGKSFLIEGEIPEAVFAPYLIRIILAKDVYKKFVYHFFQSDFYWRQISDKQVGTGQPNVNASILSQLTIPVPPFNEQRRIVAKLDSLFVRSRSAREELERIPKLCDRYKQAMLAAACSGRLTADWREQNPILETASELMKRVFELRKNEQQEECSLTKEGSQKKLELKIFEINVDPDKYALNELPSSWIWSCIDNLGRVRGGKRLPKGVSLSNDDTGFIYIRAGDLKNGTVLTDDLRFVPEDIQPLIKNYTVSAGDIYITIVGACIGDSGIIPAHLNGANLTENAAKISNLLEDVLKVSRGQI